MQEIMSIETSYEKLQSMHTCDGVQTQYNDTRRLAVWTGLPLLDLKVIDNVEGVFLGGNFPRLIYTLSPRAKG